VDVIRNQCSNAIFEFGASSTNSRKYDIKILQFTCDDEMGGPPGCLQYHTALQGIVSSFNYDSSQTSIATSTTIHLSEQHYAICFRRGSGYCSICFTPNILTTSASSAFGLSNAAIASNLPAVQDTSCSLDYLVIPGGTTSSTIANSATVTAGIERICGRTFTASTSSPANQLPTAYGSSGTNSICTGRLPFRIEFHTNEVGHPLSKLSHN